MLLDAESNNYKTLEPGARMSTGEPKYPRFGTANQPVDIIPAPRMGATAVGDALWTQSRRLYSDAMRDAFFSINRAFAIVSSDYSIARQIFGRAAGSARSVMVMAKTNDSISGFALAMPAEQAPNEYDLTAICVKEHSRRQGIGTKLYDALLGGIEQQNGRVLNIRTPLADRFFAKAAGVSTGTSSFDPSMPGINAQHYRHIIR